MLTVLAEIVNGCRLSGKAGLIWINAGGLPGAQTDTVALIRTAKTGASP
jgi:hypothetical protein